MAHKKAGGAAKNLRDSNPKYLGIKLYAGEIAKTGAVIVRQRGTRILPGNNVLMGKDHTIFSMKDGKVKFTHTRKKRFDGKVAVKKVVNIE
jgi:large subunit ribosomal protein L27